jgi:hypothetical protein
MPVDRPNAVQSATKQMRSMALMARRSLEISQKIWREMQRMKAAKKKREGGLIVT